MTSVRLVASAALASVCLVINFPLCSEHSEKKDQRLAEADPFPVSVMTLENLVRKPANLFDLEGKTVRFSPQEDGSWKVETTPEVKLTPCDTVLPAAHDGIFGSYGWHVDLPFAFPFAGKTWKTLYVNNNGNLSFEKSEADYIRERWPWSDSGMRSMAAAIDSRSVAGQEQMIAVLWAVYDLRRTQVNICKAADQLAVTWRVSREGGDMPAAGENVFQARLAKSGVIEFAYAKVPERDGIVGLFTGQAVKGKRIHQ
jgi:hypothetical protein